MALGNPDRPVGGLAVRTPPGVDIRPVGRANLAEAVAMARAEHGHPPIDDVEPFRTRFEGLINSADVAPFIATEDGRALGLGILHFRRRLNHGTFEGWISELWVQPEHRGRGIGRALVDALVAEWRLRGSHRLQIQVPDQSTAAQAALSGAGMEEWMLNFGMRPVEAPAAAMPDEMTIRPLDDGDAEVVTRMLAEFGPHRTPGPDRMEAVLRTYAEHMRRVQAGDAASTVAQRGGQVLGFCSLERRLPFWTDETHGWLADLMVTESARGGGIGRALLADALATATAGGAAQVTLESGPARTAAHDLYRSSGFAETGRTFRLMRTEPA